MTLLPPVRQLLVLNVSASRTNEPDQTEWSLRVIVFDDPGEKFVVATSRVRAVCDSTRTSVGMGAVFGGMSDDEVENFLAGDVEGETRKVAGRLLFGESRRVAAQLAAIHDSVAPPDEYVEPSWGGVQRVAPGE